jgi:ribulose-phosphate 3-epimerase
MSLDLLRDRRVAPSILSADFARLGAQVREVMEAGARVLHVDVMDGHFVPPITFGPLAVDALRDSVHAAGGVLDVHLMVERPERHVADFARAGADSITVHWEATPHVHYALDRVREEGCGAGLALNPATAAESIRELAASLELVLCMSVNPGWGGQSFIPGSLDKLRRLCALLPPTAVLEVDGGIDPERGRACADAGASLFVAGSAVFGAPDPGAAYRELADAIGARSA